MNLVPLNSGFKCKGISDGRPSHWQPEVRVLSLSLPLAVYESARTRTGLATPESGWHRGPLAVSLALPVARPRVRRVSELKSESRLESRSRVVINFKYSNFKLNTVTQAQPEAVVYPQLRPGHRKLPSGCKGARPGPGGIY